MGDIGALKPILTTLVLPPAAPLLLAGAGLLLARARRRAGLALVTASVVMLWLLSCHGAAVWLASALLPTYQPLIASALKTSGAQAIVVLGGGMHRTAPEYASAQANAPTAARLRYGMHLARASGLPLAFAGGVGWSSAGLESASEASTATQLARESGATLHWLDDQSRDTAENAARLQELMQPDGVTRIALVTHAWHMPRSQRLFEQAGFTVIPAPMGFILPLARPLLEWLPSSDGLTASRHVLREWLALRVG